MASVITPAPGTISIASGSADIVGTDTALLLARMGALVFVDGAFIGQFAADPSDDDHATLVDPVSAAITDAAFSLIAMDDAATLSELTRQLILKLGDIAAVGLQPNAIGDLADRGDFDAQGKGYLYLAVDGDGSDIVTPALYLKNSTTAGDWTLVPITGPRGFTGIIGNFRGPWLTATAYAVGDGAQEGGSSYVVPAGKAHTSGTFATDLAAGKWQLAVSKGDTGGVGASGVLSGVIRGATVDFTVASTDNGYFISCANTSLLTVTLGPAATLGASFGFVLKARSTGNVKVVPNGSETINGGTQIIIPAGQSAYIGNYAGASWYSFFDPLNTLSVIRRTVVTSSGTFTRNTNTTFLDIEAVGGGGGGGGAQGNATYCFGAGGGAGGGYSRKLVSAATFGASQTATIGAAGGAGASGGGNGGAGGNTSMGTLCVANGGGSGGGATSGTPGVGGTPAAAGTGDVTSIGGPGGTPQFAYGTPTMFIPGGAGGQSALGGGAKAPASPNANTAVAGTVGGAYGGGGSGACAQVTASAAAGGAGAAGCIIVTEYGVA